MASSKPETKLGNKVKKALLKEFPGIYLIKTHGGPYQEPGVPDYMGCYRGRFIGIELKVKGNKPTKKQEEHLERIRIAGGIQGLAYSVAEAVQIVKKGVQFDISTIDNESNTCYNDSTLKKLKLKGGYHSMAKKEKAKRKQEEELLDEEEDLDLKDLDLEEDEDEDDGDEVDYSAMTVKELKALCKEKGLEFDKKASKDDLIELLEDSEEDEEDEDDEDEDEEDEDEGEKEVEKPAKKDKEKPADKKKEAPAKGEKKKRTSPTPDGVKPPMLQDIPEGALSTADVAKMCGIEARKLRIVLRDKFYPDNGSKRYYWMPGSKELNEILDYFGVAPTKKEEGKKAKKKK